MKASKLFTTLMMVFSLAGCDPGGDDTNDTSGTNGPAVPSVSEGEIAVNIEDSEGLAWEIRCSIGDPNVVANVVDLPTPEGTTLASVGIQCVDNSDPNAVRTFLLAVQDTTLAPGSYAMAPDVNDSAGDALSYNAADGGEGLSLPYTQNGGVSFTGTLEVLENGGAGGVFRANFTASYDRVSLIEGGVATEVVDRPGAMAGAMHFVIP